MTLKAEHWGTRVGLILAMAGNAVGLGNFLRFPVQAVNNGGGAFIIPYLVCFLLMGIPLLWVEWSMGRYGGKFGNHSTPFILDNMTKRRFWKYFGVFGIFTNIAVAAYYCYIEAWTLSYVFHTIAQTFAGMDQGQVASFFNTYVDFSETTTGIPYEAVIFYILCLALNTYILSRGLKDGVEKMAKIGIPLLLLFGVFLAVRGITLGDSGAPVGCDDCNAFLGLDFLWNPQFDSLRDPKVWLAAAGQIFFTLSVGMGTVHCYAAYVKAKDDVALNAMSAGWMNGFVEIVIGASIVIPISVGYLGLDWVLENISFATAFQTMPFLFNQWGPVFATFAGVMWFGLLFFAAITSSLAMGTPWMGFMRDEFNWGRERSAIGFGTVVLIMGLPTVFFFSQGVFDEYDYWAGTVALVVFALAEIIIFSWIFGINNSWKELNEGADIKIPIFFKFVLKYITPVFIFFVFAASLVKPVDNDWDRAFREGWELDAESIIGKLYHKDIVANRSWHSNIFESEVEGTVSFTGIRTETEMDKQVVEIIKHTKFYLDPESHKMKQITEDLAQLSGLELEQVRDSFLVVKTYTFAPGDRILVTEGDELTLTQPIAEGSYLNRIFYLDMARLLLLLLFIVLSLMVYKATTIREKTGRL